MDFLLYARLIGMVWLAALAGTLVCTLYAILQQPRLRRELGALLGVTLLSAVTATRYAWLVHEKLATGVSQHPRALGVLVDMFLCSGFVVAPLVLGHLYHCPEEKRAPRPLTVAHAVIWATATTVALGVALLV